MTECYNFSCQGESHKADNKPCQDASFSAVYNDGLALAIVCDGHGGERYFRSDVGARMATEVIRDSVKTFVENVDKGMFVGQSLTAEEAITSEEVIKKQKPIDKAFRQLFSSIIYQWNQRIAEHAANTAISEWEQEHVPQKYLDELHTSETFEKLYGCTLMVYVQTPEYWFAFHLGDGKCVSFQHSPLWTMPIPWDERCFLNKTTSLCDSNAINEFRYCYEGDGTFPMAVFLGSDGMDDSFGEDPNLVNFYIQVVKMLVTEGREATIASIESDLPQLSKIGSKDDMSIAFVYNLDELKAHIIDFIRYQIDIVLDSIHQMDKRIASLNEKLITLEKLTDEKSRIDADYARQDIERANDNRSKLLIKYDLLEQQRVKELCKIPINKYGGKGNGTKRT
jgi:hypothetical protein